jgi:hypothetical protein
VSASELFVGKTTTSSKMLRSISFRNITAAPIRVALCPEVSGTVSIYVPRQFAQASLRWLLDRPGVASVIAQVHSEDQLDEFVATPELPPLEESDLARIEALIESGFMPPPEPEAEASAEADDESATDDAAVTAAV